MSISSILIRFCPICG